MINLQEMKIGDIVKNNKVMFSHLRAGFAYYRITISGFVFEFPVELSDVGNGTINRDEKALTFMRWIRKSIEDRTMIRVD